MKNRDICDRCANMVVEPLTRVKVGRKTEDWCAGCVGNHGPSVSIPIKAKVELWPDFPGFSAAWDGGEIVIQGGSWLDVDAAKVTIINKRTGLATRLALTLEALVHFNSVASKMIDQVAKRKAKGN